MTDVSAIAALSAHSLPNQTVSANAPHIASQSFGELLSSGLHNVEARVNEANALAQAFATDDSIPVHQVTIALEQARLSVELALQVRTRLVDAFHEIMNMQL
jgi:flagellar hook-basal body complex protein FliE